jgi:hypothetical protein
MGQNANCDRYYFSNQERTGLEWVLSDLVETRKSPGGASPFVPELDIVHRAMALFCETGFFAREICQCDGKGGHCPVGLHPYGEVPCPAQLKAKDLALMAVHFLMSLPGATPEIVARSVAREVARAQELHPDWPADPVYQAAIVGEEAGELLHAALDCKFARCILPQRQPCAHETIMFCPLKIEAIHVAATAVRVLIEWPETQEEGD